MSALNDPDNFAGRVNYAAAVIASGRSTTRNFDNCFENYDGSEVAVAVYRRSLNNPKIAANLFRYISREITMADVERLKDVPTRELSKVAAETRARRRAESDAYFAKLRSERAAHRLDSGMG